MAQKILVVDDDKDLVSILCDLLKSHGYQTLQAFEGIRAVEMAHKAQPDLILLDWIMPAGKGSAVLEMLAEKKETKSIPVIVHTGADEPFEEETARGWGVKGFFRKPCDLAQLLKVIESVLKRKQKP